jgi:hypothetical protein
MLLRTRNSKQTSVCVAHWAKLKLPLKGCQTFHTSTLELETVHAGSNSHTTATNLGFATYPTCKIRLFRCTHRFPERGMGPPSTPDFIAPSHPHAEMTKLLCPHHEGAGAIEKERPHGAMGPPRGSATCPGMTEISNSRLAFLGCLSLYMYVRGSAWI